MRKDVLEGVLRHIMNDIQPNYAALAKQYKCDYRTVKRYYEAGVEGKIDQLRERQSSVSPLLFGFEEIIRDKLELSCSASSIYYFIKKKGYKGGYTTVKRYCRHYREDRVQKATIRIETTPGLFAQVDWKENIKMVSKHGEVFYFNIFLYILGYSRMKYLEVTFDRTQSTVFHCLVNAFEYCGNGVPQEIWFDNMKTVVDRSKSQFSQTVFNEKFRQFSKDAGFNPIACRPFHQQTKGKVEALARTVNRLIRAHKRGTSDTMLKKYAGYSVLVIDEIGYLPFSKEGSNLLFQLINMRYERKYTIITTNIPLSQWSEIFGNKKLTNALLDRLVHHSKIIQITGPSYRMKSYSEAKEKGTK